MPAIIPALLTSIALVAGVARPSHWSTPGKPTNALRAPLAGIEKHPPSMRTAVHLWRLKELEGLANTRERQQILKALRGLAHHRAAPLPLRRLATTMLATRLGALGRKEESRQQWLSLGFVRDWWVIGPFDNEGHRGFEAVYGPEESIDLDRAEPGKQRPVGWRPAPVRPDDGKMMLQPLFSPHTDSVAYAFSVLTLSRATPVLLHLGSDDGCKVWINGKLVVNDPGSHPLDYDQQVLALILNRGDNRVLVKVAQGEGAWGFSLAVTDRRGYPPSSLRVVSDPRALRAVLGKSPPPPPAPPARQETLASWFTDRAQRFPRNPQALAEAAFALNRTGAHDTRMQRVEQLVQQAIEQLNPKPGLDVDLRLMLASATDDTNLGKRLLEQAAGLDTRRSEAASRLGLMHHIRNEVDRALQYHQRALAAEPGYLPSAVELAELLHELDLDGLTELHLERLLEGYPEVPEVLTAAANLYRSLGNLQRARELYARLASLQADDQLALRALFELAASRGDLEAALSWLDRLLELDPLRMVWWIERGDLLLYNQRASEAREAYQRANEICPEESLPLIREGLALQALGRTEECLKTWRLAFKLSPQDQELERHIEFLQPQREVFYGAWALDPRIFLQPHDSDRAQDTAAGAARLSDLTVVRLHPNGMTSRYRQQVLKVFNSRGAEQSRTFQIEYAPSRQQIRILSSRVLRPDLHTDESVVAKDLSLSEPWYNLYYDVHIREITFPGLSPGDLVELAYLVEDVGNWTLLGSYFGDLVPLQFAEPTRQVKYVLLAPAKQRQSTTGPPGLDSLYSNTPPIARYEKKPGEGGTVIHTWEAKNVPAMELEPQMPGFTETNAFLHLSSCQSWKDLARWYQGLIADQLVPGPEVKQLARNLTEGISDPLEKIRAIYRFVADRTRYVGLEFGIHSYVPYQVSQVLLRKFGDCKDKSTLLVALLREVGIPAHLALLRMNRLGQIPAAPASLAVFNHAVAYLPEQDLWLDATASFHDIYELPIQDQSASALIVGEDGGRLTNTPTTPPEHNRTEIVFHIRPAPDGSAGVFSRVETTGGVAPAMRARLTDDSTRKDIFEKTMNELFPGTQALSMNIENLDRPELPLVTTAELKVPSLARVEEQLIDLPALGRNTNYQKIFTPFQNRHHDLMLAPPWSVGWSVMVTPPEGFRTTRLPQGGRIAAPFGLAEISFGQDGEQVVVRADFRLTTNRIPAAEYQAFRAFLGEVDLLFSRRLHLSRGPRVGT